MAASRSEWSELFTHDPLLILFSCFRLAQLGRSVCKFSQAFPYRHPFELKFSKFVYLNLTYVPYLLITFRNFFLGPKNPSLCFLFLIVIRSAAQLLD